MNQSHRLNQFMFLRSRYQLIRAPTNDVTPAFAGVANVSGPGRHPRQQSGGGQLGAADADVHEHRRPGHRAVRREHQHQSGRRVGNLLVPRPPQPDDGRRRAPAGVRHLRQQNARGNFGFTGAATGSDVADFLLGLPQTSSIAFGNADKAFRQNVIEVYVNDDYRVSPVLTLNLGLRWEYESPITESRGTAGEPDAGVRLHAARRPWWPLIGLLRADRTAASSRASAWRGVRSRARRWWCAAATASTAISRCTSRSRCCSRSSRRSRTPPPRRPPRPCR